MVRTCVASAAANSSQGSAMVTGGLGSLGGVVALWLGQCTTGTVRLLGRSGRVAQKSQPSMTALAQATLGLSATCVCAQGVDVGSASGAAQAMAWDQVISTAPTSSTHHHSPTLGTLMHAGGVLRDATLLNQGASSITEVCAPKVSGAWSLMHAGLHAMPVHMAVMFSSIAALMGSPGQANYSAANSALDALAHEQQCSGQAQVSVQWGPWSGGGMAMQSRTTASRASRMGMGMLTAEQGVSVLGTLLHAHPVATGMPGGAMPQLTVSPIVWSSITQQLGTAVPDLLLEFATRTTSHIEQRRSKVMSRAVRSSKQDVQSQVMAAVRSVLGTDIAPDEPLMDAGLDSLGKTPKTLNHKP